MKPFLSLVLFFLFIGFSAKAQNAINVTGTWNLTVETDAGSGTPTFVLKQDGEKITGTYSGQLGEAPLTGTIRGEVIHLEFAIEGNKIIYDGKATSTEMEGKVDLAGMATGTFKGKKK
ncbi:hypothetical protein J0A67_20915 [Algoriphagus aestuariicola]|jgi:hypothetical protein|uniref:Uncharacterized protein n=1 Tax=Algoriphagus aestuariicola TaxID=1852016 RepID=A0ABS3BVP2_9BACT|nr:hypothetical protein [Algoriphagus aestuariicola]MBN7803350.1 hypothetical protein [Algoriphagus aestuariicola]